MTDERLKEIFKTSEKLERRTTKRLGIQENTITCDTLKDQGISEETLKQFDTKPIYVGEYKDKMSFKKGYKQYDYLGFRVFDDPVIKLYFIVKRIFAGYPEEYPVPEEEILFEIPQKLNDCGKGGTYIGGKGCRYINKEDLEDLEKHFVEMQEKMKA
jgi:hypothetical protein